VLATTLDHCRERLLSGDVTEGMQELVGSLHKFRSALPLPDWQDHVAACRRHPIHQDLHLDPLTYRSFLKPRGYAGDAVMLDMIYGIKGDDVPAPTTDLGKAIFNFTAGLGRSPMAVRYRRSLIATYVDELNRPNRAKKPRVLSIASGHLREAELTNAVQAAQLQDWIAIDSDEQSIQECSRSYRHSCIQPMKGSVRQILAGKFDLGQFDFIYAAGLFDYLSDSVSQALISKIYDMLTPSGRLLIANFAAGFPDAGYMEAFMDWFLIYRSEADFERIFHVLDGKDARSLRIFTDPLNAIVYATAQKQPASKL
jgi:SAM-dependent methyltransferase